MNENKITKTMRIGELLHYYPESADLLMAAGLHCLDCPSSQMESLADACRIHGLDVNEMMLHLNNHLDKSRNF